MNLEVSHLPSFTAQLKLRYLKLAYSPMKSLILLLILFAMASRPAHAVVTITSVTLNPATVSGGNYSTATITFSAPLDNAAASIYLTSSNAAIASVPASFNGVNGDTTEKFIIDVAPLQGTSNQAVTITATYGGIPSSAVLTVTPDYSTTVRTPTADAFVQNGTGYHDQNFGNSSVIVVKTPNPPVAITRVSYIKFDLTDVTVAPSRALLKLYFQSAPALADRSLSINTYSLPTASTWDETGITWDSAPNLDKTNILDTGGTFLSTTSVLLQAGVSAIDVTSFVQSHLGQAGTLQLVATAISQDQNGVVFYSKESGTSVSPSLIFSYPASAVPTLIGMSLSRSGIISASQTDGSAIGKVTLDIPAPVGGIIVNLTENSKQVYGSQTSKITIPATITIPAGSTTGTFTINSTAVSSTNTVTISGKLSTWVQGNTLVLASSSTLLSIQNLNASAGNACAVLSWDDLPRGTVNGYNIYRNGSTTPLNSAPFIDEIFIDSNLINGSTYHYVVKLVNTQGQEINTSNTINVIPSATGTTLSWINPPASGTDSITLTYSDNGSDFGGELLVDGVRYASSQQGDGLNGSVGQGWISLDTTDLPNGIHICQVFNTLGAFDAITPAIQIQVNNDFSKIYVNGSPDFAAGEICSIDATNPSSGGQWTVQVLDSSNNIIRTWTNITKNITLAWDGKTISGSNVVEGDYSIVITGYDPQNNQKQKHIPIHYAHIQRGLGLIDGVSQYSQDKQWEIELKSNVQSMFNALKAVSNGSFRGTTYYAPDKKLQIGELRNIMQKTDTFYLYSHGNTSTTQGGRMIFSRFGGISMYSNYSTDLKTRQKYQNPNSAIVVYDQITYIGGVLTHPYKWVMLDTCRSAGGQNSYVLHDPSPNSDPYWGRIFGIQPYNQLSQVFWGWNGDVVQVATTSHTKSDWLNWREKLLYALGISYNIIDALVYATSHTTAQGGIEPWDYTNGPYRSTVYGDVLGALP